MNIFASPGKCSNSNCAIRTGLNHLRKTMSTQDESSEDDKNVFNPDLVLITNGDSDNKFHPRYLEALTYKFLTEKDRANCVYQVCTYCFWGNLVRNLLFPSYFCDMLALVLSIK